MDTYEILYLVLEEFEWRLMVALDLLVFLSELAANGRLMDASVASRQR